MADFLPGIKPITPSYPVKPVQPTQKDREHGKDRRRPPPVEDDAREPDDDESANRDSYDRDADDKPTIDEHV